MICEPTGRVLSEAEALAVVEPYFLEARGAFVEAGFGRVGKTELVVAPMPRRSARHFASCREDGRVVVVVAEIADLPDETVAAILSHELGHAADFAYPGRFQLVEGRLVEWDHPDWGTRARGAALDERTCYARRKQWDGRRHDEVERTADAVAERALALVGSPRTIRYDGACLLQTFGGGKAPRPEGL